ncbi:MAG TPA: ATP-dependent zinc metalloprotease FtsH [Actinomycetota bacterium]|nr:ATP-dependent zinc metalloprotease FtsH [Actinomycetota bacterium]
MFVKLVSAGSARVVRAVQAAFAWVRSIGIVPRALTVSVVVMLVAYAAVLASLAPIERGRQTTVDRVRSLAESETIERATFYDEDARAVIVTRHGGTWWAAYPKSDAQTADLIDQLSRGGARILVDQQSEKARLRFLAQFLFPMLILAGLFGLVFVVISGKGGASEFQAFSKFSGGRGPGDAITFANVAAAREAIIELQEVVDYLQRPERFATVGALAPKGVLLVGPPGTGKTLLARAVAGEAGVPFFSLAGSDFVESLVGVGAARVRDLFRQAREAAPAIIFIDELDAAGRQRGAGMGQGNDEREQTLNAMLVEMDGFSASSGIVVLAATNRPDILDPALMRPGRFDRQVVVDAPDVEGRIEILELYAKKRPMDAEVDLPRIARQTPGFTGAELSNLVNEAALLAVRADRNAITTRDLEEAVDRVIAGPERRSHVLSEDEKRLVAYHEAGHAVVAAGVGMRTGVQKLSIVARGRSLGHTTTYQISDRLVLTRDDLVRQLVTVMGGVAVEQAMLGVTTTGSEGDLRQATGIARAMVATFGMGEALGRVAVGQKSGEVFLGRDFTKMNDVAPATMEAVDQEVRSMLDDAEARATEIIRSNRDGVERIVSLLMERETLSGPDLAAVLDGIVAAPRPGRRATGRPRRGRPVVDVRDAVRAR